MRNCLIMGFGRSGTSLMGGILHQAGYFMGEDLYHPRHSNPKGFFECAFINGINERILQPYDYYFTKKNYPDLGKPFSPFCPGEGHRWISYIESDTEVTSTDPLVLEKIQQAVAIQGYAYKDPRFNYTLNVWLHYLQDDVVLICMFRNPADTIMSVLNECASAQYLSDFAINPQIAEQLWINSYTQLLGKMNQNSSRQFIVIHYHQLLTGSVLEKISDLIQTKIDVRFADETLNRTQSDFKVSNETKVIYSELCTLAQFVTDIY